MITGQIFDIQHFCVDDGPGIRTTVFFKGCPLRCIWCHNAEGLSKESQLYYIREKCVGCHACMDVCPNNVHKFADGTHMVDYEQCILCNRCVDICPSEALKMVGRAVSVDEVLENVLSDVPFYKTSGGGITLSGGEPLAQPEFATALAKAAKESGLHVCIETSGYSPSELILEISKYTDIFLFDFKHYSEKSHKELVGAGNELILKNLHLLSAIGKSVILRCPIIPGCNDDTRHFDAIADIANKYPNIEEIHIEPYHNFGETKYESIGTKSQYSEKPAMGQSEAKRVLDYIKDKTEKKVIIS